jgi:hypothetical protein
LSVSPSGSISILIAAGLRRAQPSKSRSHELYDTITCSLCFSESNFYVFYNRAW